MDVGFIGLGNMGAGMARNLLRAGHRLVVYNRTRAKAEALAADGAEIADSPAFAAQTGIVLAMVANDRALEAALTGPEGAIAGLPRGGIVANMSTVSLDVTRRMAAATNEAGGVFVAAPVFGRPDAAAAGKLFVVAAGPDGAIDRLTPLFDAIGQRTTRFGQDPVQAAAVKIGGNFMLQSAIESMAEALALVRRHGVDPAAYIDFMTSSLFAAPVYKNYGPAMVAGRYEPAGFPIPLALKDTRLALEAAAEVGAPLPLAALIQDRFLIALSLGWETLDQAALGKLAAQHAGLE
jgi:3-hydroxyisobutyrate dehydrogenase-like beta-hydroxyacid dehydrogenase